MLKGTHLPLMIKEIQAGYLNSTYFKDIYLYTSGEARSVGLAKACVLQKIYPVLEKISYKYIVQTE